MFNSQPKNSEGLRVIRTARDEDSINEAARGGYWPLVKPVRPSLMIRSKYAVLQNKVTGEIKVIGDYRSAMDDPGDFETAIDFESYYPHSFPSPYAAYLVPKDIEVGERVVLEDLIQDVAGACWNQGDVFRLESCVAVWNGRDFDLEFDPEVDLEEMIG